jgi:NAD(P)-dependent dehydrogenase (short-subunit alcohol dehydrogenase family)
MSSFAQNATVVLVHGAWADGCCWQNVILPLRKEGLQVLCAPIPLTSPTENIAEPEEIAGLMAYLDSREARWLTGASVRMDSGEIKEI